MSQVPVRHLLRLDEKEIRTINAIQSMLAAYRLKSVVRLAGGWLRDKVVRCGLPPHHPLRCRLTACCR